MKKNKIQGSKKFAYLLIGAGAVGLTGIAFSAWVITSTPEPKPVGDVSISVGEVQDARLVATISDQDKSLSFDCPSDDSTGPITGSEGSQEDLQFGFTATIANAVSGGSFSSFFDGYSIETDYPEYLKSIATDNKLVLPIAESVTVDTASMATGGTLYYSSDGTKLESATGSSWTAAYSIVDTSSLKIQFVFNFAWGSYFGNQNPGKFNESGASSMSVSDIDTLKSDLLALSSALTVDNTISMTFTPKAK